MDRNIVTQVGIEDLKFALTEVAENLSAHINLSVTKAHGINVINGYTDEFGNDLNTYQDSSGTVIGNYFIQFVIGNVNYYAPANFTTFPGKPSSTGVISTAPDGSSFDSQGASSWVTDYTSDQVAQAQSMNNDVLLPHTRLPHRNAHGGLTVLAQPTFNDIGNQVGTHVVLFRYANILFNIPVSNRFGGPAQTPRASSIEPSISVSIPAGAPNTCDKPITVTLSGGTRPVLYHWQYNNSGVWTDIAPAPSGSLSLPGWDDGIQFQWADTSTATFRIVFVEPGSNQTRSAQFRCRITNAAVPDAGPESGIITNVCTFTAHDNTD